LNIVNQEIQKKLTVNWQECGLDAAKGIGGLRAVFGEQYPDPVRVVSVGPNINSMLTDSVRLWGSEASIEFCGGTHVANSSEIYKFVLLTEEGIAKGIRRIVAVTGPQAAVEATLKSNKLRTEVDEMMTLKGMILDRRIAALRNDLGEDKEISLVMKRDMINEIDNVKVGQLKAGKEATKAFENNARAIGENLAKDAIAAKGKTFVGVVDAGEGDGSKALGAAMETLSKACTDKGLFLLSSAGGKICVLAVVPKSLSDLSAKAWTDKVLQAIGGKGGGKADRAQGQASDVSKVDDALKLAKSYP